MNPGQHIRVIILLVLILGVLSPFHEARAQQLKTPLQNSAFAGAGILWSHDKQFPKDMRLESSRQLGRKEFFSELRNTFYLPEQIQFVPENEHTGVLGNTHIRYKLHYRGLELDQTQYILHLKENRVYHAHGRLVDIKDVDLKPSLSKEEAYSLAFKHLGVSANEKKQKSLLHSMFSPGSATGKTQGRLLLSAGSEEKKGTNYRLVYRFDIFLSDQILRYDVDIDAHTGELVGKYPTLFHENIPTSGHSHYYDTLDITVSDGLVLTDWINPADHWQLNSWNAYGNAGLSWWISDSESFDPGGYSDNWREVLSTDAIVLKGANPYLEFVHRYKLELPDGASEYNAQYDGWDGINIRISVDEGNTWTVLADPEPAYTSTSLWSFGGIHGEGPGIPGWAGTQSEWTRVRCDLSDYQGATVLIRFEFASDGGYSSLDDNSLFGWQIDEIYVRSDQGVHFANAGTKKNMASQNLIRRAGFLEGTYRLRETSRGEGIITLNAGSGEGFSSYVDYVLDELPTTSEENRIGVGIHWAAEKTYDYFSETFGRNSFDDNGGVIASYADWMVGDAKNNAFWAGDFAAYGAGDGERTRSFGSIDVVGHEVTHGVSQYSAGLVYQGESGALNESFSDIFGTAIEFFAEGRASGDWLIGEDVFTEKGALRSMKNPSGFNDPDTYLGENWVDVRERDDNGGVHTNSGVQNYWFYLLSEGGEGINDDFLDYQVSGIGLDNASDIAYRNLTNYLLPDSKYHDAAFYSVQSAEDLFGKESQAVQSVQNAWDAVGIYLYPRLVSSEQKLSFSTPVGRSDSMLIKLVNEGMEPLTMYDFQFNDAGSFTVTMDQDLPLELGSSESLKLTVTFSPANEVSYTDTLTIKSSDPRDPIKRIQLTGFGLDSTTSAKDRISIPSAELKAFPNPFNNQLHVSFTLPGEDFVTLEILDMSGRLIYSSSWYARTEDTHVVSWSDMARGNQGAASGLYLVKLRTKNHVITTKVIRK